MFCSKCGSQMPENGNFCAKCGTTRVNTQIPTSQMPPAGSNVAVSFFRNNFKKIILVVAAVLVVVIAIIGILLTTHPLLRLERAANNFIEEFEERVATTPFQAIPMMVDTLEHGTTEISFRTQGAWPNPSGSLTLMSDSRRHEYAIHGMVNFLVNIDFEAYINRHRLAARVPLVGNEFLGITFRTFRNDFQTVGGMFGLNSNIINQVADYVEFLEEALNMEADDMLDPYIELLSDQILNANRSTGRERIYVGNSSIRARRVSFIFDETDIQEFLGDLHTIMATDDTLRSYFDTMDTLNLGVRSSTLDWILRDMLFMRDSLYYEDVEFVISFYTNNRNRLVQVSLMANGEGMIINLGANAQDTWTFSGEAYTLQWQMDRDGNEYIHVISHIDSFGSEFIEFTWNRDNGNFMFNMDGERITGNFNTSNRGRDFMLRLDSLPMGSNETITFTISGTPDVSIATIHYINMPDWGNHLISSIQSAIWDLIMGGLF